MLPRVAVLSLSLLALPLAALAAPHYAVTPVAASLGDWTEFIPSELNNQGQVIGTLGRISTATWQWETSAAVAANGVMRELQVAGAANTIGYAINNGGTALVGVNWTVAQPDKWNSLLALSGSGPNGTTAVVDRTYDVSGNAINDYGQVAGSTSYPRPGRYEAPTNYAFTTTTGGGVLNLNQATPIPNNWTSVYRTATDVNNAGVVVGNTFPDYWTPSRAYMYSAGTVVDLGNLGGASLAFAVNDNGVAVGSSATEAPSAANGWLAPPTHAVIYDHGLVIDLGYLGDKQYNSRAYDINNHNEVVGMGDVWSYDPQHPVPGYGGLAAYNPFLVSGGHTYMLNDLIDADSGWTLQGAISINEAHQILGWGRDRDGQTQAVLLSLADPVSPVPEPSMLASLVAGLALLGGRARRMRRATRTCVND